MEKKKQPTKQKTKQNTTVKQSSQTDDVFECDTHSSGYVETQLKRKLKRKQKGGKCVTSLDFYLGLIFVMFSFWSSLNISSSPSNQLSSEPVSTVPGLLPFLSSKEELLAC